jgi:predicted N-acetyltransferase YhbS
MARFEARVAGLLLREGVRGDRDGVADLFTRAEPEFPLERGAYARMWDWLHWNNAIRPSEILVGEDEGAQIQGHVAMLPVAFSVDGEAKLAGWPCQLMVDESRRHSLLYPAMVQQLLRSCGPRGYDFAYALINRPRVLRANIALGLKRVGEIPVWARPYRPASILGKLLGGARGRAAAFAAAPANFALRMLSAPRERGIVAQEIGRFEPEIDALFESTLMPAYRYVARRDSRTLNWRFFGLPERRYRVFVARTGGRTVGYVAYRTMPMQKFTALGIADVWYDPSVPEAGRALMAAVHRGALAEQVDLAACVIPRASPMAGLLRKNWFFETPESFTLTVYQPRGSHRYVDTPITDWHPTWYDHDYV